MESAERMGLASTNIQMVGSTNIGVVPSRDKMQVEESFKGWPTPRVLNLVRVLTEFSSQAYQWPVPLLHLLNLEVVVLNLVPGACTFESTASTIS